MPSNLAGPFVASLLSRAERSQRWAAEKIGVSHVALGDRLRGVHSALGIDRLLEVARLVGATEREQLLVQDMHAIDRGAWQLDPKTTPEELQAAREAIQAARVAS